MSIDMSINFAPFSFDDSAALFNNTVTRIQANFMSILAEQIRRMMPIKLQTGYSHEIKRETIETDREKPEYLSCRMYFEIQKKQILDKTQFFGLIKRMKTIEIQPSFVLRSKRMQEGFSMFVYIDPLIDKQTYGKQRIAEEKFEMSDLANKEVCNTKFMFFCHEIKRYITREEYLNI